MQFEGFETENAIPNNRRDEENKIETNKKKEKKKSLKLIKAVLTISNEKKNVKIEAQH